MPDSHGLLGSRLPFPILVVVDMGVLLGAVVSEIGESAPLMSVCRWRTSACEFVLFASAALRAEVQIHADNTNERKKYRRCGILFLIGTSDGYIKINNDDKSSRFSIVLDGDCVQSGILRGREMPI